MGLYFNVVSGVVLYGNARVRICTFCLTAIDISQEDSSNYTCEVRGPHSVVLGQVTYVVSVRGKSLRLLILIYQKLRLLFSLDTFKTLFQFIINVDGSFLAINVLR